MFGQKTKAQIQALRQTVQTQALIIDDITTVQTSTSTYRGNQYKTYSSAVKELARKYEGTADWGVLQTGNILDVRAAFIIGQGLKITPKDKAAYAADKELEFVQNFIDYNDLDREMAQEFAKEAEIEGRFLGQLFWDEAEKMVSVRFRSWSQSNYTVETDKNDYSWFKKVTWNSGGQDVGLDEPEFVYARFGGRVHQPNLPYPKVAKCLGQIENLDKALRDWYEITRLYAGPIPHVECETVEQAKYMKDNLEAVAKNWKLKRLLVHTGKLSFAQPDASGVQYLENLILSLAKMISGTTGVPVGLMGLGDLTTKLGSSSEITADQLTATTSKERQIWIGTYEQMISKAIDMWNENSKKTPLQADALDVNIPLITSETWKRIGELWLPLYLGGAISLKTLLAQIPDVDAEQEMEEKAAEAEENMQRFRDNLGSGGGGNNSSNQDDQGDQSNDGAVQ